MSSFCFERSSCRFWWRRKSHAWKRRIQPDLNKKPWQFPKTSLFKVDGFLLQNRWTLEGLMNFRAGFSFLLLFFLVSRLRPSLMRWKWLVLMNTTYFTIQRISTGRVEHPESFLHFFVQRFSEVDTRPIHLGGSLSGRVWNNFWTLSKLDNLILFNFSIPLAVWRIWKHQWITWFQTKAAWNWSSWEAEVKPWKFSRS